MAPVIPLRIHAVDVAHAPGNVGSRRLDQQMIMIGHQAVSGYTKIPHIRGFDQHLDERLVILFIDEYRFTPPTPVHDVIPGVGNFDS